ncbi:MAG: hypothetical protein D3918_08660 [Candidatus Electrothrix sp. AX2]|nr:hypothetical protein [Candidatus Electrothrix gigas]
MSEWFDKLGTISIGCQSYGPEDPYGDLKVGLWKRMVAEMPDISIGPIRHFAIALRVGAQFKDFDNYVITHVRAMSKIGYIGCDIEIPISEYTGKSDLQLRRRLVEMIGDSVNAMIVSLRKKKYEGNYERVLDSLEHVCNDWVDE